MSRLEEAAVLPAAAALSARAPLSASTSSDVQYFGGKSRASYLHPQQSKLDGNSGEYREMRAVGVITPRVVLVEHEQRRPWEFVRPRRSLCVLVGSQASSWALRRTG